MLTCLVADFHYRVVPLNGRAEVFVGNGIEKKH
jgi:hypothetical protein